MMLILRNVPSKHREHTDCLCFKAGNSQVRELEKRALKGLVFVLPKNYQVCNPMAIYLTFLPFYYR